MFYSILFRGQQEYGQTRRTDEPDCFKDLNLDQVFAPILASKKEFELEEFFYTPLRDVETIAYRQEVMRELEDDDLRALFASFSRSIYRLDRNMAGIRASLTSGSSYDNNYLTRGRMLDYAERYCNEISALMTRLERKALHSEGLRAFAQYLRTYTASETFKELSAHVARLREGFSKVEYCMLIRGGTIRVRKYEGEDDYSKEILACFEKFRQGEVKDYSHRVMEEPAATHVEAAVLNMVASLYKSTFTDLDNFCDKYLDFLDATITRFSREVQFYLAWLEHIRPLRNLGLPFCYPMLCNNPDHIYVLDGFDLALAFLKRDKTVTNDLVLNAPERIVVVTGPNQGGKTTFARAFGQVHWLSSLGLCVPGREAAVYLCDKILTHFAREEDVSTLNGRLQDDILRLRDLLERATSKSVIIINEIFSSTTLSDALVLGGHMMDAISALGAPTVVVTFLDELASYNPTTVSMVSTVNENDPTERTYKILRKPADGLAYAIHLASKYGLTYMQLCRRLSK